VAVSARTGRGLDELRAALARAADAVERRVPVGGTRLWVDRVFTLRGIGTVATGTLWSGAIADGDELRVEPAGRSVRVRSVQVHDAPVERAEAGQRVAVNLAGLERAEVARGDALVAPGFYPVTYRLDVRLDEVEDVPAAVTVHLGTADVPARVVREGPYAQLRLERPVAAARGDRVVLRTRTTVGGGRVLDPSPPRRLEPERLAVLDGGDPAAILAAVVHAPVTGPELQARGLLSPGELAAALPTLASAGEHWFSHAWLDGLRARTRERLAAHAAASPLDPGLPLAELVRPEPWAPAVLNLLELERRGAKAYLPGTTAELGAQAEAAHRLEAELAAGDAVRVDDRQLAAFLEEQGTLRRVGDGFAVSAALYDRGVETVRANAPVTLAGFRDAMGISRRTAQLLLERYDADGLTRRVGEQRVLRRRATS
jgi:selenocysteine-specific elongation factor